MPGGLSNLFIFQIILFNSIYSQPLKFNQLTLNLQKILTFLVSNDGFEWSLDFGPDSVTLTVEDFVQEMTINSQEIPLADWSLLLSQRQQFLKYHLVRVAVTPNKQGTHEMRDEVLSSVGAQDMDKSEYQVSADLHDVEFFWENDQLDVDAVFRPGIETSFRQQLLMT